MKGQPILSLCAGATTAAGRRRAAWTALVAVAACLGLTVVEAAAPGHLHHDESRSLFHHHAYGGEHEHGESRPAGDTDDSEDPEEPGSITVGVHHLLAPALGSDLGTPHDRVVPPRTESERAPAIRDSLFPTPALPRPPPALA